MFQEIANNLFAINSIWSIIFRGVVWFGIAIVIIVSVDGSSSSKDYRNLKSNLGFFFMFLVVSTVLVSLLFGYAPQG